MQEIRTTSTETNAVDWSDVFTPEESLVAEDQVYSFSEGKFEALNNPQPSVRFADLTPGEFGYDLHIAQPRLTRQKCVDACLIPEGSWSIQLFDDGHVKSWESDYGTQFSERGRLWWVALDRKYEAELQERIAATKQARRDADRYSSSTVELDWRDRHNASK